MFFFLGISCTFDTENLNTVLSNTVVTCLCLYSHLELKTCMSFYLINKLGNMCNVDIELK